MIYLPPFVGFVRLFSIVCGVMFIAQMFILRGPFGSPELYAQLIQNFGLVPADVFTGHIYQLITWVFLHGSFTHLIFNLLGFWMFGSLVESKWGTRRFRNFCILAGLITGLGICLFGLLDKATFLAPTIGASGIVFAAIMAVSVLFPDQVVLFFFVFPMKMKYFAYLMVAIEFYALWSAQNHLGTSDNSVSNIGHLTGAVAGYILAKTNRPGGTSFLTSWSHFRERWHQKRMRKKLRVIKIDKKISYH